MSCYVCMATIVQGYVNCYVCMATVVQGYVNCYVCMATVIQGICELLRLHGYSGSGHM